MDLHRTDCDKFPALFLQLAYLDDVRVIEARVENGEDKSSSRPNELMEGSHERGNLCHVEQCHIAERRVK